MNESLTLHDVSSFNTLVENYNKNKLKKWNEWLDLKEVFSASGKQGLVGLFETKEEPKQVYIFKLSQYINYLIQHELSVIKSINRISMFCPHFCRGVGAIIADIDPNIRKKGNPFNITCKYPIEKEILLLEYIDNSRKLYSYIKTLKKSDNIIYSCIKQVLLAINIAQQLENFVHYDLHSNNIMVKKCSKDLVFLYVLDENNQFAVSTNGYYPIIIDYGFAYSKELENKPLWPSLAHTHVGFLSDRFDAFADPKLFLVTVADELDAHRNNKNSKKFNNIVKNLFAGLKIDWVSGWDTDESEGASDVVNDLLRPYFKHSKLFEKYEHYCIDIIQTLITIPIQSRNVNSIEESSLLFINEFVKIEKEIGNLYYLLYLLKCIVDVAREIQAEYMVKETRDKAVKKFRKYILYKVDTISKYCMLKEVHFEKLLCGLISLVRNIETKYHFIINNRIAKKTKMYNKVPLKNLEQMFAAIDINIPDEYIYNENTTVMMINVSSQTCEEFGNLPVELCKELNENISIGRGNILYSYFTKN